MKNPLCDVFNMRPLEDVTDDQYALAELPQTQIEQPTAAPIDHKDEDDILVEKRIDEVYDAAIDAYRQQQEYIEVIEPRYAARSAEVAANFLTIALTAANSRAKVKTDRKRANQVFIPHTTSKTTNNVLVADRNEILKMISLDDSTKNLP